MPIRCARTRIRVLRNRDGARRALTSFARRKPTQRPQCVYGAFFMVIVRTRLSGVPPCRDPMPLGGPVRATHLRFKLYRRMRRRVLAAWTYRWPCRAITDRICVDVNAHVAPRRIAFDGTLRLCYVAYTRGHVPMLSIGVGVGLAYALRARAQNRVV